MNLTSAVCGRSISLYYYRFLSGYRTWATEVNALSYFFLAHLEGEILGSVGGFFLHSLPNLFSQSMPNYFVINKNGQKQGSVTEQRLKELATSGFIDPNTPLETDSGHKGVAGQIPGLVFNNTVSPSPKTESTPPPKTQKTKPQYYYPDANGQKHGPVTEQQLRALAAQGIITPTTPLETNTGYKGVAGQIKGLFPEGATSFASAATKGKELAQQGMAGFTKGAGEVMAGLSAAKAAAKARLRLNDLNSQLVTAFRALGDVAEQAGWGGEMCQTIRKQREDAATATAWYGKAATDAELAKNTPGVGAAKQVLREAKKQMVLVVGVLDGLREKAGRMLMDDTTTPHIGSKQRAEILRLIQEIAECQSIVAHGKKSLVSKPMIVAVGLMFLLVGLVMLYIFCPSSYPLPKTGDWVKYDVIISRGNRMENVEALFEIVSVYGKKARLRITGTDLDGRGKKEEIEIDLSKPDVELAMLKLRPWFPPDGDISKIKFGRGRKTKETMLVANQTFDCVITPYTMTLTATNPNDKTTAGTVTVTVTSKEWRSKAIPVFGSVKSEAEMTVNAKIGVVKIPITMTLAGFGSDSR